MSVTRIFVEKKPDFAVKAKELQEEIKTYLNISTVTHVLSAMILKICPRKLIGRV